MREALEVNREGMIPLRSPPGLDSTTLGRIIGYDPCICLVFILYWRNVELYILFGFWHRGVP